MKIVVIGPIANGYKVRNGQTIKARNLVMGLKKYTNFAVDEVDTYEWSKNPIKLLHAMNKSIRKCDDVIMLPAHNGVKVFAPLLMHYKTRFHVKVYYDVIGGWLPKLVSKNKRLARNLREFDGVWVETTTMKYNLERLGFHNISVVPNFKEFEISQSNSFVQNANCPLKLCIFSRVMKEKGIETAVDVITDINEELGYTAYTLDIYGQVEKNQEDWFSELQKKFPDYILYKGSVESSESTNILKNYFALLFPTHFYTEGIPGTILDAFAAGLPVISAKWGNFSDIIEEGSTGYGYEFDNVSEFKSILYNILKSPQDIDKKREECKKMAKNYSTKNIISKIKELLRGGGINL